MFPLLSRVRGLLVPLLMLIIVPILVIVPIIVYHSVSLHDHTMRTLVSGPDTRILAHIELMATAEHHEQYRFVHR
jgi:hypothetical protein